MGTPLAQAGVPPDLVAGALLYPLGGERFFSLFICDSFPCMKVLIVYRTWCPNAQTVRPDFRRSSVPTLLFLPVVFILSPVRFLLTHVAVSCWASRIFRRSLHVFWR